MNKLSNWSNNIKLFDWKSYTNMYDDLKNLDENGAKNHWINFGQYENRTSNIEPFDLYYYMNINNIEEKKAITHWKSHGLLNGNCGSDPSKSNNIIDDDQLLLLLKENDVVIINPYHGLGNRLRTIASAYSMCKKHNKKLVINWRADCHCECMFTDLYETPYNVYIYNGTIDEIIENNRCIFDVYNYIDYEPNSQKNMNIECKNMKNIYIKAYSCLNCNGATEYMNFFICSLVPVQEIKKIINSICLDFDNTVAMHIRMEAGENLDNNIYDKGINWTSEERELMYKYRNISNINNFITQIFKELKNDPTKTFYITTDMQKNYDMLINIFGPNKIKYLQRSYFDRCKYQNYYAVADIIVASKCHKFYGSFWSSFTEMIISHQTKTTHNILSNNFDNTYIYSNEKISVVQCCKNRNQNLLNSVKSYIDSDIVDDIVIVDWGSTNNVKLFLENNGLFSNKLHIVEIIHDIPWIASWGNNIGLYFAKNNKILKLDADNLIKNIDYLKLMNELNTDKYFYSCDWKFARTENDTHLNGIYFTTKNDIKLFGYHNNDIVFYGWEDCEIKNRFACGKIRLNLDFDVFYHQPQSDEYRVINQQSCACYNIDFYGFNVSHITNMQTLIQYNRILCETHYKCKIFDETSVKSLFEIEHDYLNYTKLKIIKMIDTYDCNYANTQSLSCCRPNIFENMYHVTHGHMWNDGSFFTKGIFYDVCKNIKNEKYICILFYVMQFKHIENKINSSEKNGFILLHDSDDIIECIDVLYYIVQNITSKKFKNIHILSKNGAYINLFLDYMKENIKCIDIDINEQIYNVMIKKIMPCKLHATDDIQFF